MKETRPRLILESTMLFARSPIVTAMRSLPKIIVNPILCAISAPFDE